MTACVVLGWVLAVGLFAGGSAVADPPAKPLTAAQLGRLKERDRLLDEVEKLSDDARLTEAVATAEKIMVITREVFGNSHEEVAAVHQMLGSLHLRLEQWDNARKARTSLVAMWVDLLGEDHWRAVEARRWLADVTLYQRLSANDRVALKEADRRNLDGLRLHGIGKFEAARDQIQRVFEVRRTLLGDAHPTTSITRNNLAAICKELGDFAKAEPLLRDALAAHRAAYGDTHPHTATAQNNLGGLYQAMGDLARAEPLLTKSLAARLAALGETHQDTVTASNNLATLYHDIGDYVRAEPLFIRASAVYSGTLGESHWLTANSRNNLARLYEDMGRHEQAESLYTSSLAAYRGALGDDHPSTAGVGGNLALLYQRMGDLTRAELLNSQALAAYRTTLGDAHRLTATSRNNLARLYHAKGDYARAEPLARQAVSAALGYLDRTAVVQSEQSQVRLGELSRHYLSNFLMTSVNVPATDAYQHALRWKGQVFVRQRRQRELVRANADPVAAKTADDLLTLTRRLATIAVQTPEPSKADAWKRQVADLIEQQDRLDADLARMSAGFRRQKEREQLTPAALRKLLPAGTALVDFFRYDHFTPVPKARDGGTYESRLTAFVVRPDRDVVRVELGPAKPVEDAVEAWRKTTRRTKPVTGPDDPAVTLRDSLWKPLAAHLAGCDTVLVSPDGPLARLPFAALPGSADGKYLVEEVAVAVLPVPQFLPDLVAPLPAADPSLLVVGGIDYGADPGKPPAATSTRSGIRGDKPEPWPPLTGAQDEVAAVKNRFDRAFKKQKWAADDLQGDEATEEAVRQAVGRHRWVHFATHGFFAPAAVKAVGPVGGPGGPERGVAGHHPGLLSGLVLAGANRPPDPDKDDGILTAAEVATLDLSAVELAVLSACETGLGPTAGGEGVLGLQRAFQVAGARTVVASLWKVDDDATRGMMSACYGHWLDGRTGPLAGLVAAQRAMLRGGVGRNGKPADTAPPPPWAAPHYWAGFVLSGDWR